MNGLAWRLARRELSLRFRGLRLLLVCLFLGVGALAAIGSLTGAIAGELAGVEYRTDPVFGFEVPVSVPGVESSLLQPRLTWADPEAYDAKARELADMFRENFSKFTADDNIVAGGPS